MNLPSNSHPSSYRDPSGFIYKHEGIYYRFVSDQYKEHYEHAKKQNLFDVAKQKNLLLPFEEIDENHNHHKKPYKTLLPDQIVFENYPWEWCFDQYKDAAIMTLKLCKLSLENGMILKDATPLNIRLIKGKMKWIDHLSFEIYKDGDAWVAYRQFCEMFLNPLLIATYCGIEAHRILLAYPGGISADTTASLLPFKCRFRLHIQLHVYLQKKVQQEVSSKNEIRHSISKEKILRILESLYSCIQSLGLPNTRKIWSNYYEETILSQEYLSSKKNIVSAYLSDTKYQSVLDAGCNDGAMTLLCNKNADVIAADNDSICINQLYYFIKKNNLENIYPVVLDLTFPTGGMGWSNDEYPPFLKRIEFDLILALALIHHLCIGKNIPLTKVASLFAGCGKHLLIEFVPKEDPKVQDMLLNREDIFNDYSISGFEYTFSQFFTIIEKTPINNSQRTLYKMVRK
jgi:hypothetical protein